MPHRSAIAIPPAAQLDPLLHGYAGAVAARRRQLLIGVVIVALALTASVIGAEVDPTTLWDKIGNFGSYFDRLLTLDTGHRVWTDPVYWFWGLHRWSILLGQTILIAYAGTITGAVAAFAGCFLCSRNLVGSRVLRVTVLRLLEFCRTVPDLVFAMIFVVAFGLGPLAGIMAIALHTAGALGKLFAEIVENIETKPVEGIRASGASWFLQIRFGVLPQVLSGFVSYALLRFEVNVRGAAVIGFVGAGGIGEELIVAIRKFFYSDVSAILLMLVVCVMLIDLLSERVRHRLLMLNIAAG